MCKTDYPQFTRIRFDIVSGQRESVQEHDRDQTE